MRASVSRVVLAGVLVAFVATAGAAARQRPPRTVADRMAGKINLIMERGLVPRRVPLRTSVSEAEINAYLAVYGPGQLPAGVINPRLSILGGDRVAGTATIDLDAVRRASGGGWFDLASYLTGRLPVNARGVLRARDGVARFQLEVAEVAGVPIPKTLLQQIVAHYSRSTDFPQGINLDDPLRMPAGIRAIEMRRGEAVVVQQ